MQKAFFTFSFTIEETGEAFNGNSVEIISSFTEVEFRRAAQILADRLVLTYTKGVKLVLTNIIRLDDVVSVGEVASVNKEGA